MLLKTTSLPLKLILAVFEFPYPSKIKILEFLWKKSNLMIEYCLFYGLTYVFTSLYVVRGITEGGLKVCLTIFIGLYFFKFVLRFIKKSIRVTNFKIENK